MYPRRRVNFLKNGEFSVYFAVFATLVNPLFSSHPSVKTASSGTSVSVFCELKSKKRKHAHVIRCSFAFLRQRECKTTVYLWEHCTA
jgi:hypothetical protein